MRRKDREVTDFEIIKQIIDECEVIRIGLSDGEYPYIVPMNFGYEIDGKQIYIYLHGAQVGRKIDLMKKNGVCSFEMDCGHVLELIYEAKDATMRYKCVMGKADIEFLEGEEKQHGLDLLMARDEKTRDFDYNRAVIPRTAVIKLTVTEWTGKMNPVGGNAD